MSNNKMLKQALLHSPGDTSMPRNASHVSLGMSCDSTPIISANGRINIKRDHKRINPYIRDPFHTLVDMPWTRLLIVICLGYLMLCVFFAAFYEICARDQCLSGGYDLGNTFLTSFFFSVQTLSTIGFGEMHPTSIYSNAIVTIESMIGIIWASITFGIVYAKFARATTRSATLLFSNEAVVSKFNGTDCLMFRILNVRKHQLVGPRIRLYLMKNEVSYEGETFYRFYKLKIHNSSVPFLGLPWTVMHRIDKQSPLYNLILEPSEDDMMHQDAEIIGVLEAMDASTSGAFQARKSWQVQDVKLGYKFRDMISRGNDGQLHVDQAVFHKICRQML